MHILEQCTGLVRYDHQITAFHYHVYHFKCKYCHLRVTVYLQSKSKCVWEETGMRTATNELCVGLSLYVSLCTVVSMTVHIL